MKSSGTGVQGQKDCFSESESAASTTKQMRLCLTELGYTKTEDSLGIVSIVWGEQREMGSPEALREP
ncbi:MAG: hypothetical protein QM758_23550 [Armatimonas sp.]